MDYSYSNGFRFDLNHADEQHGADWYIGSQLYARVPIQSYSAPEGTPKRKYSQGALVGTIYSFTTRQGFVWWQLTDKTWVKHVPGAFDTAVVEATASGKEHEEKLKTMGEDTIGDTLSSVGKGVADVVKGSGDALSGIGNFISNLGNNLLLIIIIILIAWVFINTQTSKK